MTGEYMVFVVWKTKECGLYALQAFERASHTDGWKCVECRVFDVYDKV